MAAKRKHPHEAAAKPKRRKKRKPAAAPKRKRAKRKPAKRRGAPKPGSGFRFEVERIKLDRRGYDQRGRYYGREPGMKLYQVKVIDKATDIYQDALVKARTVADAKSDVMASMMRSLSSPSGKSMIHAVHEHRRERAAPKHKPLSRPAFSGASLGPSTVSPHRGERSFSDRNADLAGEIARVSRAARAASERGELEEAGRLGLEAEQLYADYERGAR